jgi:hypothetical protein
MEFIDRVQKLKSLFTYDHRVNVEDTLLTIHPFHFVQELGKNEITQIQQNMPLPDFCSVSDDNIEENKRFRYVVFVPKGLVKSRKAIILLHGLNEHSWEKYLPWAESLALKTGLPTILFPIAFHINRTPLSWYNPRTIFPFVTVRKQKFAELDNTTFVNLAISSRISESPLRFYISGRETLFNLWQLMKEIKNGRHPLFKENTSINIFAYSIGAFLSQVLLLANPESLTSGSRLFMFCGGTIFSRMNGSSRDIMDQESFEKLRTYYLTDFLRNDRPDPKPDSEESEDFIRKAFQSMLSSGEQRDFRESFYRDAKHRIQAVTLKKDTVIPTSGVREAFGEMCNGMVRELDFPYEYSHQIPFPVHNRVHPQLVQECFSGLFNDAAAFLA